jgi:phosphoribosylformylglycinamidine synthase
LAETVIIKARNTGVTVRRLGLTNGDTLTLPGERPILVKILSECFEHWLPAYMAGHAS